MAERSKALVLGTSLFGGVSSNSTAANLQGTGTVETDKIFIEFQKKSLNKSTHHSGKIYLII